MHAPFGVRTITGDVSHAIYANASELDLVSGFCRQQRTHERLADCHTHTRAGRPAGMTRQLFGDGDTCLTPACSSLHLYTFMHSQLPMSDKIAPCNICKNSRPKRSTLCWHTWRLSSSDCSKLQLQVSLSFSRKKHQNVSDHLHRVDLRTC
jgi:hypothetical protein